MAPRKGISRNKLVAKIVTGGKVPCSFCQLKVDDELTFGKLYAIGDIQCHYFCVLLSSCLVQKGKDNDGLFGFIYEDILNEIERAKKHRCSYCSRGGATLGCAVSQCRKQFHLPCGRERNAVSLFYGNYKSFCQTHAPKQNIPAAIMAKAQQRKRSDNKIKRKDPNLRDLKELSISCCEEDPSQTDTYSVCVICYEAVDGYPTINTFWPPCCARDAWFHRTCLQRMALSAGMHYLKCPLCNDKDNFYQAVVTQGYYVPDRDAAWELEQNAFAEIYDREISCSVTDCQCPMGRSHDAEQGSWCIKLCLLCGSSGAHVACLSAAPAQVHVCVVCTPAAPQHIEQLASCIEAVITQEQQQSSSRTRRGPVMPSRMSLRRTKRHTNGQNLPSCSSSMPTVKTEDKMETPTTNTSSSRQDLNLKTPKKPNEISSTANILQPVPNNKSTPTKKDFNTTFTDDFRSQSPSKGLKLKFMSPTKLLEETLKDRMGGDYVLDKEMVDDLRKKFRKPKPLSEKRRIVNDILNGMFDGLLKDKKQKDPVKQWFSPKKREECGVIEILDDTPPSNKENTRTPVKVEKESESSFTTPKRSPSTELRLKFKTEPENTYPIFNSPKKLTTVDILKGSSLEISAKDEIINIDVINIDNDQNVDFLKQLELKSPQKSKKCAFKFSPYNKEVLDTENIDIDMESFKDQYLNEVGLQRVIKKVTTEEKPPEKISRKRNRKRKLRDKNIVLKYDTKKRKRNRKNISIKNKNIQVKIKWREEQFKLKITDSKKKKKKLKKFQQYILECSPKNCSSVKPKVDITPMRKKYKKPEKTPDNLIQTSIQSFFKVQNPGKN